MRYIAAVLLALFLGAVCLADGLDLPIGPEKPAQPVPQQGTGKDPRDEPPPTLYGEEIDVDIDRIVYVIDISCSMTEDYRPYINLEGARAEGPRIDRAKVELSRSISNLPRNMKFSAVAYSCSMRIWSKTLQEANTANKASAVSWVQGLEPTDATATGPAVALGLSLDRKNLAIVLLTDGAPNCGTARELPEEHRKMIRDANTQNAQIFVFGISPHAVCRTFCQQVSNDSHGTYREIP